MHIPRQKYQLTLHALSEIQLNVNNVSINSPLRKKCQIV